MALLRQGRIICLQRRIQRVLPLIQARCMGLKASDININQDHLPWNYLWQPGPYPTTKEAREAAAAKYGMIPEDYEPYDESDHQGYACGDYPKFKPIGGHQRDGHYDWDFIGDKRNYGEPVHIDHHYYMEGRIDTTPQRYSISTFFLATITCVLSILIWPAIAEFYNFKYFHPVSEPQLYKNRPHYTWEFEDDE